MSDKKGVVKFYEDYFHVNESEESKIEVVDCLWFQRLSPELQRAVLEYLNANKQ